jgi:hypothetical protein
MKMTLIAGAAASPGMTTSRRGRPGCRRADARPIRPADPSAFTRPTSSPDGSSSRLGNLADPRIYQRLGRRGPLRIELYVDLRVRVAQAARAALVQRRIASSITGNIPAPLLATATAGATATAALALAA